MHAIFCQTVESTKSATAVISSVILRLLVKFKVVQLTEDEELLVAFIVEFAPYNLRVELVLLFVVEFYVSVDDVWLELLVLLSVVVLSEVELSVTKSSV